MDLATITEEALMEQLDSDKPRWAMEWADQTTLRELVEGMITKEQARIRVIRTVWPVVRAVYCLTAKP